MPDHDAQRIADIDPPGEPTGVADLQDAELQEEIELVADLVVAASASPRPLSVVEIDRILGLRPT